LGRIVRGYHNGFVFLGLPRATVAGCGRSAGIFETDKAASRKPTTRGKWTQVFYSHRGRLAVHYCLGVILGKLVQIRLDLDHTMFPNCIASGQNVLTFCNAAERATSAYVAENVVNMVTCDHSPLIVHSWPRDCFTYPVHTIRPIHLRLHDVAVAFSRCRIAVDYLYRLGPEPVNGRFGAI
jgi:hypothetical protein